MNRQTKTTNSRIGESLEGRTGRNGRRPAWLAATTVVLAACGVSKPNAGAQPATEVYAIALTAGTPSGLPKCTSSLVGTTAYVQSPLGLYSCISGIWVPLPCTSLLAGAVAYGSASKTLLACASGQWTPVALPAGPTGATGAQGPQGATGAPGLMGAPGPQVQVTPEPPGTNCPAGGQRIDVGSAGDGGFTVDKTVYTCNGTANGPGGVGPCNADADCDDHNLCTNDFCASGTCAHSVAPARTVCRAANGPCDSPEYCDGSSTVCSPDVYAPAGSFCGGGGCETQSTCTGKSTACPATTLQPAGYVCRSESACALAAVCDGATPTCPSNQPKALGTVCRDGYACLTAATCDGTNLECPENAIAAAGTACVGSESQCSLAGTCDGASTTCAVSEQCTSGDIEPCTCGTLVTGSTTCTDACVWGSTCNASAQAAEFEHTIGAMDPSVQHGCGAADPDGWEWASTGCAANGVVADWTGGLPGYGTIKIGFDTTYGYSSFVGQIFINGTLVKSVNSVYNSQEGGNQIPDQDLGPIQGCNTFELRILSYSGTNAGSFGEFTVVYGDP